MMEKNNSPVICFATYFGSFIIFTAFYLPGLFIRIVAFVIRSDKPTVFRTIYILMRNLRRFTTCLYHRIQRRPSHMLSTCWRDNSDKMTKSNAKMKNKWNNFDGPKYWKKKKKHACHRWYVCAMIQNPESRIHDYTQSVYIHQFNRNESKCQKMSFFLLFHQLKWNWSACAPYSVRYMYRDSSAFMILTHHDEKYWIREMLSRIRIVVGRREWVNTVKMEKRRARWKKNNKYMIK